MEDMEINGRQVADSKWLNMYLSDFIERRVGDRWV